MTKPQFGLAREKCLIKARTAYCALLLKQSRREIVQSVTPSLPFVRKSLGVAKSHVADARLLQPLVKVVSVRVNARKAMKTLAATKDLNAAVIAESMRILSGCDWRGQEQSALLLAQLDHKPAAGRLVELLTADRPEAFVAAAWGLRALAVPATLPAVSKHVETELGRLRQEPGYEKAEALDIRIGPPPSSDLHR